MRSGFNTQPPEGGWIQPHIARHAARRFNTQPPEGGWASNRKVSDDCLCFQHTAARRRLVDVNLRSLIGEHSFNTQPPEGGWSSKLDTPQPTTVSTHSRPKAAGDCLAFSYHLLVCFNTQPPEGGWTKSVTSLARLPSFNTQPPEGGWWARRRATLGAKCFNTQPPEGGWNG